MTNRKYSDDYLISSHKGCSSHKDEILSSKLCGCFCCEQIFPSLEIEEWFEENIENGETAICPKCGIDSVLSSQFPIEDKQFLHEMNKYFF